MEKNKQEIKLKRIDYYTEIRKGLWTAILVLTGSLAGILLTFGNLKLNPESFIKVFLFLLGLVSNYLLITTLVECSKDINKLFKEVEGE